MVSAVCVTIIGVLFSLARELVALVIVLPRVCVCVCVCVCVSLCANCWLACDLCL